MRATLVASVLALLSLPLATHATDVSVTQGSQHTSAPLELALPFHNVGMAVRADLGGDGVDELIISSGANTSAKVAVLRLDGSLIGSFAPYDNMTHGVTVAVGDTDGDGSPEIITGTMIGGGPHIRVFNAYGHLTNQFFAYADTFHGGVNVATADITGDGIDEIITAAGLTGGPHVRAFRKDGTLVTEFFAFSAEDRSGITVTRVDQNHDGKDELVIARFGYGAPEARIASLEEDATWDLGNPFQLYVNYPYGVTLFPVNDDVFGVAPNGHGGPHVRMLRADGQPLLDHFAFDASDTRRVIIAATTVENLLSIAAEPVLNKRLDRHILVDLSEQRLWAYEDGIVQNTFHISTGKPSTPTPIGEFSVMRKLRHHRYRWFNALGELLYDLPNVEYNLEFTRHYYIHHAYWHNNWGTPVSGGCVNAPYEGVQWIYNWAEVGTSVIVQT